MVDNLISEIMQRWWLIFLLPVFAGIIRSTFGLDSGKKRRRKAQREVKKEVNRQGHQAEIQRVLAEHDAVNKAWLEYELDVAKVIDYPLMSDAREPLTVAFLRAKRTADGLRPETAEELAGFTPEQLVQYRNAVRDFEVAFDVAEREAKRLKDQRFTETERQRLNTAKRLLRMAEDGAATPAERRLAYQRARKELEGLIVLPEAAFAALEQRIQAAISEKPVNAEKPAKAEKPTDTPRQAE